MYGHANVLLTPGLAGRCRGFLLRRRRPFTYFFRILEFRNWFLSVVVLARGVDPILGLLRKFRPKIRIFLMASSTDFSNRLRNASRGSPPALPIPVALINSCSTVMFSPFVKLSIVIRQQQRPTLALHRLARPAQSPTLRLALLLAGHFTPRSQTTFPHRQGQRAGRGCSPSRS